MMSDEDDYTLQLALSKQDGSRTTLTADERRAMIQTWADAEDIVCTIVSIEDINDPPNWVKHAQKSHGIGTLVTTDLEAKQF